MGGTVDSTTTLDWGIYPAYEHVASQQKALVVFENADHFIFNNKCDDEPWVVDTVFFEFCSDPVWDMARAHDLINHLTTAFLLDVLKGDKDAHKAPLPDAVKFAGIAYKTTLK